MNPSAAQALAYIEMGLRPIPVPLRSKKPVIEEWQKLDIKREEVEKYFPREMNIGVLLGDGSKGVADVDLDTPEAVAVATIFLPTTAVFGRATNPRSHHVFYSRYAVTTKFVDHERQTLVELRANKTKDSGNGLQTIFPDSIHESGERIEWDADSSDGDIAEIKPEQLRLAVARIAVTAYLIRLGWAQEPAVAFAQSPDNRKLEHVDVRAAERIRRWLGIAVEKPRLHAVPTKQPDHDVLMKRASAYLARIPGAVAGNNGHDQTWDAALAMVRGFGLGEAGGLSLLSSDYNHRCDPPWDEKDLAHKAHDAANAAHVGWGWLLEDRRSPSSNNNQQVKSGNGQSGDRPKEEAKSIFSDLIELGDALTPELIALQKEPLPTGIPEIDERLGGGYFCGELIVVQASTGVGKTSFNLFTQCTGVSLDAQRSGLYITTEMQPHELQARRACQVLNEQGVICNWRQVLNGTVPLERTREATANSRVHVLKMKPSETPVERIRLAALHLAEKYGKPPLIIADYLQALSLGIKEDRRIAVGTTIYALQELAVELQTPVVAISSISRGGNTKDKRDSDDPYEFLNIAKEAGEIEFAASVLCHLDVKAQTDEKGWRAARFILAKSRFGSPGIMGMRFHGSSGRFEASRTSALTEFELAVISKILSGTHSSANSVAKSMVKNRPKVLQTVRALQALKLVEMDSGYLKIPSKIVAELTDQLASDSSG